MESDRLKMYGFRSADKKNEIALDKIIKEANKRGLMGVTTAILQDALNLWLSNEGRVKRDKSEFIATLRTLGILSEENN
jgi:hypothetical protein